MCIREASIISLGRDIRTFSIVAGNPLLFSALDHPGFWKPAYMNELVGGTFFMHQYRHFSCINNTPTVFLFARQSLDELVIMYKPPTPRAPPPQWLVLVANVTVVTNFIVALLVAWVDPNLPIVQTWFSIFVPIKVSKECTRKQ